MTYQQAVRTATPVVISIAGRSGSGKSYSSLLLARGLAGPEGKVCVIDTENRRSRMYADDPEIGGFHVADLYAPFTSAAYIQKIDEAEKFGADVLVIDSMSHEWTGIGGAIEQADAIAAEAKKRGPTAWIKPKVNHRRMMNRMLAARCHVICCLRAGYKLVSYTDDRGNQAFAESQDLMPEQEKNFIYEMTVSATLDDKTHLPVFTKCPKPLLGALQDGRLIGKDTGEIIRAWVNGGQAVDAEVEAALRMLRDIGGEYGRDAMTAEWKRLPKDVQGKLKAHATELQQIAAEADALRAQSQPPAYDSPPESDGPL